jgi:hypothetical protein
MLMNPVGFDILGIEIPTPVAVFGFGIVLAVVGIAWFHRITRGPEDGDDHWRFQR